MGKEPRINVTVVSCPHCRQSLQIDPSLAGQVLQCPRCRGALVAPGIPATDTNPTDDTMTNLVLGFAFIVGHVVIWSLCSLWLGLCLSTFLFLVVLMVEFVVWKWKPITEAIQESIKAAEARRQAELQARIAERKAAEEKTRKEMATSQQERIYTASVVSSPSPPVKPLAPSQWELPELSKSTVENSKATFTRSTTKTRSEPIPKLSSVFSWFSPAQPSRQPTLNDAGAQLPVGRIEFLGAQHSLRLERGTVLSPLVYATASPHHGTFDASLIDGSLPVAPPRSGGAERLPYWPNYYDASPEQRSRYLDWLVQGRTDPDIEIGYVFIYFYGLERRVLIDDADHEAIVCEILRLRGIYSESRSFQRYSASLLWMILALTGKRRILTDRTVAKIFETTTRWDEEALGRCLSYLYEAGRHLTGDLAFTVAQNDPRAPTSVIVRRHDKRFRELFQKRYSQRFPSGIELRASKRSKRASYVPASPTLSQVLKTLRNESLELVPDVLAISSQFKPMVGIWNECLEDLRAYDKAQRGEGELSAAAYEALPTELRAGDHPEFDAWFAVWQECEASDNVPIVPISRLASLKGIQKRNTLLKSQCQLLLNTADCLQIGIEPDARLLGRNYRWEDVVTLFFSEESDRQEPTSYQAAAALLQLGLYIAEADDQVNDDELRQISRHIQDSFEMSPGQVKRIEALRSLLVHRKPDPAKLFQSLRRKLPAAQRILVGEYLLGIAAADQVVTHVEASHLRRVFTALDIPIERLDEFLSPLALARPADANITGAPDVTESDFQLDHQAISRIMRDTQAVATILQEAMVVEEECDPGSAQPGQSLLPTNIASFSSPVQVTTARTVAAEEQFPVQSDSLPPRFAPFLDAIVTRPEWSEQDAKQLARQHGVMLSGAIEAINEWSQDKWGDWLIEDGDPIRIRHNLLERS